MMFPLKVILLHLFYLQQNNMSDKCNKYKRILDREDEQFKRAMKEEVSTLLSSKFSNKQRISAGVDIIAQSQIDLPIFKQCLALFPWLL